LREFDAKNSQQAGLKSVSFIGKMF
jgi:hypothetical protein